MSHVTGGGLAANLARVLPAGLDAHLERSSWRPAPVFDLIAELGGVARPELEATVNMGVGMVVLVAPEGADNALGNSGPAGGGCLDAGSHRAG